MERPSAAKLPAGHDNAARGTSLQRRGCAFVPALTQQRHLALRASRRSRCRCRRTSDSPATPRDGGEDLQGA